VRRIETHLHATKHPKFSCSTAGIPDVKLVSVQTVTPSSRNARTHSKKQIGQIVNSIARFGWTYPLLVDELGNIIAGHGRFLAAKALGLRQVPVIVMSGLAEAEKRALSIADNKIAANAGWDRSILATELGELAVLLPECNLDISFIGFEAAEIDALGEFIDSEQDAADTAPRIAQVAVSRRADFWLLGRHRLICGDAGTEADFRTLMGGEQADMVFADGPYNVCIAKTVSRGKIKHREFSSGSGEMTPAQFTAFNLQWMTLAARYSKNGSIHYACMDWRHLGEMLAAGEGVYSELKNIVVWAKTNAGQGSLYRSQHELIFVFKNGEEPHQNNIELGRHGRNRSNVWTYAGVNTFRKGRLEELTAHPTAKPVALVADAMRDCSRRGDIILDPFMGSGTTILAAERIGRRGYGLEIDPLYVDVAIRRWQDFTRRDAILKSTGKTFDEVTAARANLRVRIVI
jgi:DNA modification methylase